jgi:hypothetical protein
MPRQRPQVATSRIQGSSVSQQSGLQTEITADATGGYDLGYVSPNATSIYGNINFSTSVSGVSVRTAGATRWPPLNLNGCQFNKAPGPGYPVRYPPRGHENTGDFRTRTAIPWPFLPTIH